MTFDEWADEIAARVRTAVPDVNLKRKVDDVCRWIHAGKECQLHAVSDSLAAFVALRRDGFFTECPFTCHLPIAAGSEEEIARRIVGWFGK
jgi:hypothetical protein